MPRYAFGTPDGGSMELFWVEDHPSDKEAIESAMEDHRQSWPEFSFRMAHDNDETFDLICEVAADFPLDDTSLSGSDEMNLREVARIVTVTEPEAVDEDEDD